MDEARRRENRPGRVKDQIESRYSIRNCDVTKKQGAGENVDVDIYGKKESYLGRVACSLVKNEQLELGRNG